MTVSSHDSASPNPRRVLAGLCLLVVLLAGTSILPWQRAAVAAPSPVRVAKASVGDLKASISLSGELRPTDQIEVLTRVGARVTRTPATVGRTVAAGDVLAELDRSQQEIALTQAQAALAKERAALVKLQTSVRPDDLAREEANVGAAEAKLTQVRQGSRAEDIEMASQRFVQARETRSRTASALANSREQARIAVEQAVADLQRTQALYGAAKLVYDEAVRTGKDPNIASCPSDNRKCNDLTDIKLRAYKADYEAKEIAMRSAELAVAGRQLAYDDARRQEAYGLQFENARVADALASLEKSQSGPDQDAVAKAEADLHDARAKLSRAQNPYQEPELQAALASVAGAEAAVRLAEANLQETVIVAPFSGIITQRYVSVGSVVSASAALFQLVSTTLEARLSADDTQVAMLEPGQRAELRLAAYPGVVFTARVDSISPSASTTSRTFTATVIPESPDGRLKPGMLVQGDVAAINRPGVLLIPEPAIVTRGLETVVFVVVDGKARRKPVTLGVRGGGMVEVLDGLTAGESVIVDGQAALNDNDQVNIVG